ncbi:MAG: hypothetical protein H5T92_00975, partial [Synergistales bacterium]|nr:hypothetical protein [Synergistales bacterium]
GSGEENYIAYVGDAFYDNPGSDTGFFPFAYSDEELLFGQVQSGDFFGLHAGDGEPFSPPHCVPDADQWVSDSTPGIHSAVGCAGNDSWMRVFVMDKGKKHGFLARAQSQIFIETSDGRTYEPVTAREFISALREMQQRGTHIRTLIVKGHATDDLPMIDLGDDGLLVIAGNNILASDREGNIIEDITPLLLAVTDGGSVLEFRGCHSATVARQVDAILGGLPTTWGSSGYVVGIPWTYIVIGGWESF